MTTFVVDRSNDPFRVVFGVSNSRVPGCASRSGANFFDHFVVDCSDDPFRVVLGFPIPGSPDAFRDPELTSLTTSWSIVQMNRSGSFWGFQLQGPRMRFAIRG